MKRRWIIAPKLTEEERQRYPELPALAIHLLSNRGIKTQEKIDEFLNPDYSTDIHDPFLFTDMEKAIKIIFTAIQQNKKITIHGDYDADGVCASAMLFTVIKKIGGKKIDVFLPHREIDGYGINLNTVKTLKEQGTDLIITCDCGISNIQEVKAAQKNKMQVIITDHHTTPEQLPPADAIIHPLVKGEKYPDKGLSGGGVAFKLLQGLLKEHKKNNDLLADGQSHESFEKWSLDLAAISIIGDMMPLIGEARTITRYGLTVLNKTKNIGLKKLMQTAGILDENNKLKRKEIDSETVAFQIVPRINAAGRMEHANVAFALLVSEDEKEAKKLAEKLNQNNLDRQKLTEQIVNQARKQIKDTKQEENPILFAFDKKWNTGILGLIAGKLKDEYYRPVIIMGENDGEITGSGRSIYEFNLIESLQKINNVFSKFGGHPQACGFSLINSEKIEEMKKQLMLLAKEKLKETDLTPIINVDAEVNLEEINWELFDILEKFSPFGQKNEAPKYCAKGLTIINIEPVGQDGKHLRLMVKHHSHIVRKTIGFGLGNTNKHPEKWRELLKPGDKIDIVFTVGVNQWNGNRELQLTIEDLKKNIPN